MQWAAGKYLLFLALLLYFARSLILLFYPHLFDMNTNLQFQSIFTYLNETPVSALFSISFEDICRRYKADPRHMESLCYDTFGMSGDELLQQYIRGVV